MISTRGEPMSNYLCTPKIESEGLRKIEMQWLKKQSFLDHWKSGVITWTSHWGDMNSISFTSSPDEKLVTFHYEQSYLDTGEKKTIDYQARLTTTPCNFGGERFWFICPLQMSGIPCGRRVAVLYKGGE